MSQERSDIIDTIKQQFRILPELDKLEDDYALFKLTHSGLFARWYSDSSAWKDLANDTSAFSANISPVDDKSLQALDIPDQYRRTLVCLNALSAFFDSDLKMPASGRNAREIVTYPKYEEHCLS